MFEWVFLFSPQVRSDYMHHYATKVSDGMALQLGCLEIRWVLFNHTLPTPYVAHTEMNKTNTTDHV